MISFSPGKLAGQLGIHRNTLLNWIKNGQLPAQSIPGRRYLLSDREFEALCRKFGQDPHSLEVRNIPDPSTLKGEVAMPPEEVQTFDFDAGPLTSQLEVIRSCLTCGSCSSACPVSGIDGLDPRKALRMIVFGREQELIASNWFWKCTLCGKCEEACPMNVELVSTFRKIRGLRDRDKVPGPLHKGVLMCLQRGNNLGIPKDDFIMFCEDLAAEMAEDCCPGFTAPVDRKGSNILVTVNSKEPFAEPDDMKFWWKIFYAAGESWTIPSDNWEGVNWGLFTGDDESMKTIVGRLVENMYKLECQTLLLPE
jgi:excisionase family DNA binding protein